MQKYVWIITYYNIIKNPHIPLVCPGPRNACIEDEINKSKNKCILLNTSMEQTRELMLVHLEPLIQHSSDQ